MVMGVVAQARHVQLDNDTKVQYVLAVLLIKLDQKTKC